MRMQTGPGIAASQELSWLRSTGDNASSTLNGTVVLIPEGFPLHVQAHRRAPGELRVGLGFWRVPHYIAQTGLELVTSLRYSLE